MSLLSLISLTVILARIEKHFVDAELGTYNLEECIKELHPSPHPSPHSSPTSSIGWLAYIRHIRHLHHLFPNSNFPKTLIDQMLRHTEK